MDTEQMFRLIDSILPFEGCLYYQILPLSLEGSSLNLGMVNPKDASALDYARRILAYLNCSLKPQQIAAETHQSMLSAYLNYTSKLKINRRKPQQSRSTVNRNEQPTLIVESPAQIDSIREKAREIKPATQAEVKGDREEIANKVLDSTIQTEDFSLSTRRFQPSIDKSTAGSSDDTSSASGLPILEVQAHYLSRPIEVLLTLMPPQLLQELLGRVIISGIGRLYFERQQHQGRILWSQDGVLQSVLEGLSLPVFQGVVNELKRMAQMPLIPVEQTKQVEIERRYQQSRLLLCLRVMPGQHGEEATLQVLRGAALRFYQQQQVAKLSRDALNLAQQLQLKLNEIRDRTKISPSSLDALPALDQLLESMHQEIEAIRREVTEHS